MRWIDLLRMSSSNLRRRKLRTFLTVLGVIIGTASIVVMISLGLGLQESLYREVEQSGGVTTLTVTGQSAGEQMWISDSSDTSAEENKYVDDAFIAKLKEMDHIVSAEPVYQMSVILLKGKYIAYEELYATTPEGLRNRNIEMRDGGRLPDPGTANLEVVYGNMIIQDFQDKKGGGGYWETGELPDVDLEKDALFMVLDQDAYYNSQSSSSFEQSAEDGGSATPKTAKKHIVTASGVVKGGVSDYTPNSYAVYCDLNTLKPILKKEFNGRVIPGQPSTKSGKPYKDFYYSCARVKVDDLDMVDQVSTEIRQMGYNVDSNIEYMNSMKKEFAIIEAVLGGIGAVSLFVAAIGIANTMMMSIYERTKEIGVIKVLGCSLKNIRQMFLLEAAAIGLIGGAIGNALSFLISWVINTVTSGSGMVMDGANISYIPLWLVLASLGFAVFVGVAAGYFPALRAMRLSPLAAIRSE